MTKFTEMAEIKLGAEPSAEPRAEPSAEPSAEAYAANYAETAAAPPERADGIAMATVEDWPSPESDEAEAEDESSHCSRGAELPITPSPGEGWRQFPPLQTPPRRA